MKTQSKNWLALASLVAGLGLSGSAHAVWTFDNANVGGIGNYANCSLSSTANCDTTAESGAKINATTVSLSGFYAANTSGVVTGKWTANALTTFAGNGQGMYTGGETGEPYHALDNNVNTEAVLLSFSDATALTSIGLGYTSNGTTQNVQVDMSVFRWTGGAAPTLAGTAGALGGSWELVGNYGDMVTDTSNPYNLVNSTGKTSSWWLISAYNSGFTQSAGRETRGTLTNSNDYFKLFAVAGTVCSSNLSGGQCNTTTTKVPEPATLALTSVALLGVVGLRRRKSASAA